MVKTVTPPKPLTKTELLANIATTTELPKGATGLARRKC